MLDKSACEDSGLCRQDFEGKNEVENLPKRVDRYGKAKARSREMQAHLSDNYLYEKECTKLSQCGNWLLFHFYYTIGKVRLHKACFCKIHLLCPLCAILRASKFMRRYVDKFKAVSFQDETLKYAMITLTIKNGPNLNERFNHLKSCYRKLEQSRRDAKRTGHYYEWGKVLGLVGTYEFTNRGRGWHPHMHIMVFFKTPLDENRLRDQWKKISKDSFQVKISQPHHVDNPAMDFLEVFKYSLKFGEMSLDDNLTAYNVLSGQKLVFSAGIMRGVKVPENLLDEPIDPADLPYIEILFSYQDAIGYSLKEYVEVPF